jgi:ferredoxin-thioredoxin reductase catalytic chain
MSTAEKAEALVRIRKFVETYCEKSGTTTHPDCEVTEAVIIGLADNLTSLGRPRCPCRFYPD